MGLDIYKSTITPINEKDAVLTHEVALGMVKDTLDDVIAQLEDMKQRIKSLEEQVAKLSQ